MCRDHHVVVGIESATISATSRPVRSSSAAVSGRSSARTAAKAACSRCARRNQGEARASPRLRRAHGCTPPLPPYARSICPTTRRRLLRAGLTVRRSVRTLDADDDVVIAAMLQPLLDAKLMIGKPPRSTWRPTRPVSPELSQWENSVCRPIGRPKQGLESGQAEALRKMLLAVIGDVRLCGTAGRTAAKMRAAKSLIPSCGASSRPRPAKSTRPRQSIGRVQLKWELEDLAFRYLQPADYKRIAAALNAAALERERYMKS